MKKLILSFALLTALISSSFAENNFAHRFCEFKVDVPVSVSNNLMGITDIFQKNLVIDLPAIANGMGDKGAAIKANATPSFGFNLDIPNGLILGLNVGAQVDISAGISKDIFDFLGNGNEGSTELKTQFNNTYADLFAFASVNGGWNGKKLRVNVTGSAFWALAHMEASNSYVRVYNNEETNVMGVEGVVDANVYSSFNIAQDINDILGMLNKVKGNLGFDLSADVKYDLFRYLSIGVKAKVPVVPSRLSMVSNASYTMDEQIDIGKFFGASEEGEGESGSESGSGSESEEEKSFTDYLSEPVTLETPYYIHRPLKFGVSADFHPFGKLLTTTGYVGMGVRHPFSKNKDEIQFYLDYAVGGRLSLWNILSYNLSHSCNDQIFKNEFSVELNIRLLEIDAGVSAQSSSFAKSFTGAGVGAFVTLSMGF